MTKIYLIRHAEAEGNIYRRAHGHYNGLVTERGHKQIALLSRRFTDEQIDAVYSSDLSRAVTTAKALSEPRNIEISTTEALREVDMGIWEDRTWGDIEYSDHDMNMNFENDPANWQIEGGEPYENVGKRILDCLTDIAKQHDGGTVAAFSHGFAIRTFLCKVKGIQSHETHKVPYCDNTAVTLLTYENDTFTVEFAGDNLHLDTEHSTFASQTWWRAEERKKSENLRFLPLNKVASDSLIRIFRAKAGERAHVDIQYAAFLADEPVGIIGMDSIREKSKGIGWVSYIHVVPQHRNNTFGTQLLGHAISDFRKLKREKLRMELPSGSQGINFLSKNGLETLITTEALCRMEKDIRNW